MGSGTLSERVYRHAPVLVQHAMVSAYGWRLKQRRLRGSFPDEVRQHRQREWWSESEWQTYTQQQLSDLLVMAYRRVPYYRETWRALGLTETDLAHFTPADLPQLPPLEKSVVRDHPHDLLVDGKLPRRHIDLSTSGSTGTPITTIWEPHELQRSLALREARSLSFAGVSFSMPRATFGGRIVEPDPNSSGPFYRYNIFERQVYLSAFHLRPDAAHAYVRALARHGVQWITGYSHSITQLARFILDQGLQAPALKAVITTSEKVTPGMRTAIEQAFSTRVYEEYGTVENAFFACECEHGRKHISPDAGILEVVDSDFQPVPPGVEGEVVATGFIRPTQPLIRYRIGDRAVLAEGECPCGRQMPLLQEVVGRLEDVIYGPDGRRMVRFHGIFIDQPHIQEGQIIQESLDHIHVRVVPKPGFGPADRESIIVRLHQRLTDQVRVTIEEVPAIERAPSGKFRAVISKLTPAEIERFDSEMGAASS